MVLVLFVKGNFLVQETFKIHCKEAILRSDLHKKQLDTKMNKKTGGPTHNVVTPNIEKQHSTKFTSLRGGGGQNLTLTLCLCRANKHTQDNL